ncbi:MAG TPA: bacillithiol system redox-active protein YtxJ [Hanamia sp.]|nr:bacillithiol system redox-active protein YtxJ [Hanamia sp.]
MNWIPLEDEKQLDEIISNSNKIPQVIFKHSTRCSVSSMAKNRLDKNNAPNGINFYFLDLIKHRNLSNKIADYFEVRHQSPQVLVIINGKCVYNESHSGITFDEIEDAIMQE